MMTSNLSSEQIHHWFVRLKSLLPNHPLACENGSTRIAEVDEFMLMQASSTSAAFKHRDTRNYLYVTAVMGQPSIHNRFILQVPMTREAFHRGFFDKCEFDPVAYQKALDELQAKKKTKGQLNG